MARDTEPAYRLDVVVFDQLLAARGLSDTQFVAASGIADRTLSRIRAGQHDITMPNVRRILALFPESSFGELFTPNPAFEVAS